MRTIKFRVWEPNAKEMIYNGVYCHVSLDHNGVMNCTGFPEDVIPLQYTGLKDKKGKDVFEGDIINIYVTEMINEILKAEVIFNDGAFCIKYPDGNISAFVKNEIEVIGNVYENPELLQKNNEDKNRKK